MRDYFVYFFVCSLISIGVLCIGACSNTATSTATSPGNEANDRYKAPNNEPWFCQVAETQGEWECIQSETLAASPKPTRVPESLDNPQPPSPDIVKPFSNDVKPAPAKKPTPVKTPKVRSPTEPTVAPTDSAEQEITLQHIEPRTAQKPYQPNDIPAYVTLSYRPEKAVSILDLPESFYAVQLVALSTKAALEAYAKKHNIRGMSAARVAAEEKIFYILLLGIYENRSNAEQSIASLTAPFATLNTWVRSVGSLQKAMLAADAITGTTQP